ncbi:hypothetical protein [Halomonas denitrificans]|nr:hypothetical protein [Halomonas denitrificans]
MIAGLFESGRAADLVLVVLVVEAVLVCVLGAASRVRRSGGLPVAGLLFNLAAGACLVLALRAVLTGADWRVAGAWLGAALAAHVGDVVQRLRAAPRD